MQLSEGNFNEKEKFGHRYQMGAWHKRQTGRLTVGRNLTSTSTYDFYCFIFILLRYVMAGPV
jgi:hypothetical protein